MAQQHTPPAVKPAPEPDSVFWARCYVRELNAATRLLTMACGHNVSTDNRKAIYAGASALDVEAKESLRQAREAGGLLFCWADSALEGGAA